MTRCTSLSAVLFLTVAAACAPRVVSTPGPAPIAGDRVRYAERSDSAHLVESRLVSLNPDSLVVERFVADHTRGWVRSSFATDSIARLQVHVGRRSNAGRGALIGGLVGVALGVACASEGSNWVVSPGACFVGYSVIGVGTGMLIGTVIRSDVWAPTPVPGSPPPTAPVARRVAAGIGFRLPLRLAWP